SYELKEPFHLPAGSKLLVIAEYDNSANNPYNPDADRDVRFRAQNQSWDEMFTPFIQYSKDAAVGALSSDGLTNPRGVEIVGCLTGDANESWRLTQAGDPEETRYQSTTMREIRNAGKKPLGSAEYKLVGSEFLSPAFYRDRKVAARGVLLETPSARTLNITSLQPVGAASCMSADSVIPQ
ncbi:MAG: hypothetical protein M3N93_01200, partial [Acidobacteriota bacterium]|nr:hypothetical protein [Acidobacteriota bacterium]